jgi:hypothetical protein
MAQAAYMRQSGNPPIPAAPRRRAADGPKGSCQLIATIRDLMAYAAYWRVLQVGLTARRRHSYSPQDPAGNLSAAEFSLLAVWRYAASLAGSTALCQSAYCSLGGQRLAVLTADPYAKCGEL